MSHRTSNSTWLLAAGFALPAISTHTSPILAENITVIRVVALSGDPAPGAPSGVTFTSFRNARIDVEGNAALFGFTSNGESGIWAQTGEMLQPLALFGEQAPGTPAFFDTFTGNAHLQLDDLGGVAFNAMLFGGDVCDCDDDGILDNETGIWSSRGGEIQLLMRERDPAPQLGVPFENAPAVRSNAGGLIASTFFLRQPFPFFAVYREISKGDLQLIALEGEQAPGTPQGVVYNAFQTFGYDNDQRVSIIGTVLGPGITECNNEAIWKSNEAGLFQLIAREGDPAPGAGPETFLGSAVCSSEAFDNYAVSPGGRLAFIARLKDAQGAIPSDEALYILSNAGLELVLRSDVSLPALNGLEIEDFAGIFGPTGLASSLRINESGQIVFVARLSGMGVTPDNDQIIGMIDASGALVVLARRGDQVPGAPEGTTFGSDDIFEPPFHMVSLNANGQVVFSARILPGSALSRALILSDESGALHLLAMTEQSFDLAGDGSDVRIVNEIQFDPHFMDGPTSHMINDAGEAVFVLIFADGTAGTFIATHTILGDITGEGVVNIDDLFNVIAEWGPCLRPPCPADLDQDGDIDIDDLFIVIANWS